MALKFPPCPFSAAGLAEQAQGRGAGLTPEGWQGDREHGGMLVGGSVTTKGRTRSSTVAADGQHLLQLLLRAGAVLLLPA